MTQNEGCPAQLQEPSLAGTIQLEAEQRGEMARPFQRRKTEAYPEGLATGERHGKVPASHLDAT